MDLAHLRELLQLLRYNRFVLLYCCFSCFRMLRVERSQTIYMIALLPYKPDLSNRFSAKALLSHSYLQADNSLVAGGDAGHFVFMSLQLCLLTEI